MINIRSYKAQDWSAIWAIIEPVFRAGSTYAFSPNISETEAKKVWIEIPQVTYVCEDQNQRIVGSYYIKPNQPALGAHVCNCGYIVAENARGQGIASTLCQHSQEEAVKLGFKAMQYNLVVSTNQGAIRIWKKQGFNTIGLLPKAFNHQEYGLIDALIMYKLLDTS
jgi:L-amino acid N-acyltransferase YncA